MTDVQRRALVLAPAAALLSPSALAQAPEPPTAESLFGPPAYGGARLSPDGRRVAFRLRAGSAKHAQLMVLDLGSMKTTPVAAFDGVGVGEIEWVNADRLVFRLAVDELPRAERTVAPGLFAVNADASGFRPLVQTQSRFLRDSMSNGLLPLNTFFLRAAVVQP